MAENLPDTNVGNIEYIRREDAVHTIMGQPTDAHYPSWYAAQIEDIPAADVVPVVHGEWLPTNDDNKKRCNKCDMVVLIAMYPSGSANFCPNCGAKMDGNGEE